MDWTGRLVQEHEKVARFAQPYAEMRTNGGGRILVASRTFMLLHYCTDDRHAPLSPNFQGGIEKEVIRAVTQCQPLAGRQIIPTDFKAI